MRFRHEDSVCVPVRQSLSGSAAYMLPVCMNYMKKEKPPVLCAAGRCETDGWKINT